MADALSLQLNIENSLVQTLQESQKVMKSFNSNLEKAQKQFQSIDKSSDKIVDHYDDIEESQKKLTKSTSDWGKSLSKIGGFVKQIAGGFLAIFSTGGLLNMLKQTMSLDNAMKDLSYRMGEGGRTAGQLKDAVYEASAATGIATEKMGELVTQLRELRVPTDMMQEMATNTGRFMEITGVTADNAGRLAGELMRTGRLGADATTNIMAGMVNVQRAVGMTSGEMQELSEGIIESTKMLNQMGKSAAQIENFNKGVVKLAGAFTQVGLSAADANKFVSELLDPGRVEDNAFLYAKLGISMEDAFSGNVDPGVMAARFKDLGAELKNMSGPAAAAMAEQLGMPLGQLRQMSEMDLSQLEDSFSGGASGAEQLASAQEEQLSAQDRFEKGMNQLQNTIMQLMDGLMPLINTVSKIFEGGAKSKMVLALLAMGTALTFLFKGIRRKFFSVATDTKKAISTAIMEGMSQGSAHGAAAMRDNISGKALDRQARVQEGAQHGAMQGEAADFSAMAGGNLTSRGAGAMESHAEWLRTISAGAKPVSRLNKLADQRNKRMQDSIGFARQEYSVIKGIRETRAQTATDAISANARRIAYLDKQGKLTAEQQWEKNKLINENNKAEKTSVRELNKLKREGERLERRERVAMNAMTDDAFRKQAIQLREQANQSQGTLRAAQKRAETLRAQQDLLQAEVDSGNLTLKQQREHEQIAREISSELNEQEAAISAMTAERNEAAKQLRTMKQLGKDKGIKDIFDPDAAQTRQSIWRRMGTNIKNSFREAGKNIHDGVDKAVNSARGLGERIKSRLNPRNMVASVRNRFSAEGRAAARERRASGDGGGLGGLLKMAGPVLMIARMLMKLEPVQKVIGNIMEKIRPILQQLGEKLAPIIQKLADALMPVVTTLIDSLMPVFDILADVIGNLVGALGPIIGKLIEFLMPPLIKVLGGLLLILGKTVEIVGRVGKFIMELPERFLWALPKALGGKGRGVTDEEEKALEDRMDLERQNLKNQGLTNMFGGLNAEGRQRLRAIQEQVEAEMGIGAYEASAELQQRGAYQAFQAVEDFGLGLQEAGRQMFNMNYATGGSSSTPSGGDPVENAVSRVLPAELRASGDRISIQERERRDSQETMAEDMSSTSDGIAELNEQQQRANEILEVQTNVQVEQREEQTALRASIDALTGVIADLSSRLAN